MWTCVLLFFIFFFFLMIRRPPRSTLSSSSAASDVYKRQVSTQSTGTITTAMADHDAHAADAEARAASDKKVVDNTNKASNCCKENCGALGRCLAGCKEKFDTRVKETPLNRFRLGLRFCNMFMAVVVLFCVLLGLVSLGIDSYGAFVLSAFLLVGGIILLILEMVCCCPEFEGRLRRNLPFLYYARGRAWLVVLFAVLVC
eukprot:TRINITY_DN7501_c0_g1_i2.p1 TRINITY_DN7501_c0_g1~~TRINITY_DN7501_c0_g1_i2.p1  ORF type:complete len:201 (-),score=40.04 TRINITY_DN7501_c0_g1_i2:719-1321(-)